MKSREAALRLKRFDAQEKVRKAHGIEQMIREFQQMSSDLERQIQAEEERTGVKDRSHFAYSTFAKSASQRREKLQNSIEDLKAQLDAAVRERDEALAEISADEDLAPRDFARSRRRSERLTASPLR
jgi:hypothetical protein